MSSSNLKRVATTTFLSVPLLVGGCASDNNIQVDVPSWDSPADRPVEDVTQRDEIRQVTSPKVDILWMIDNSGSMGVFQDELTENFPAFMDFFVGSGLDYHVGVTSSDLDGNYTGANGKLVVVAGVKYLDPEVANPLQTFEAMASLGDTGSSTEQGSGAVYKALEVERDGANDGFWRDDAALHTVIISDEPDLTRNGIITQDEFIEWYAQLKGPAEDRTFSSIVDPLDGGAYRSMTNNIGGIFWSLLQDDWTQVLELLGVQAAGLKREYYLSRLPVQDTIHVSIDDEGSIINFEQGRMNENTGEFTGDYMYDPNRNSVVFFEYVPNALATVIIDYTVLASLQDVEEESPAR